MFTDQIVCACLCMRVCVCMCVNTCSYSTCLRFAQVHLCMFDHGHILYICMSGMDLSLPDE